MATHVFKDNRVFYGGREITGLLANTALNYGSDLQDATVLGDGTRKKVPGLITADATVSGYWDGDMDADIFTQMGGVAPELLSFTADTVAEGDTAFAFEVHQGAHNLGGPIGEIHPFSLETQSAGPLIRGVNEGIGAKTVTGTSAGTQLGTVAAGSSLYAALHVVAVAGAAPTLDVIIQSDDSGGFGTPTTQLTFTQATTLVTSQFLSVAGAIADDFFRAQWTITGGSPSYTIFVVIGISANS